MSRKKIPITFRDFESTQYTWGVESRAGNELHGKILGDEVGREVEAQ